MYFKQKFKPDWNGIGLQEAYRWSTPYYLQYPANQKFFSFVYNQMHKAAKMVDPDFTELKAKPQIVFAFIPNIPHAFRAPANIGLSIFTAADAHRSIRLSSFLPQLVLTATDLQKTILNFSNQFIDTFLLYQFLLKNKEIADDLNFYRFISASTVDPKKVVTVHKLMEIALHYCDIYPFEKMKISRRKRSVFSVMADQRQKYLTALEGKESLEDYMEIGVIWLEELKGLYQESKQLVQLRDGKEREIKLIEKHEDNEDMEDFVEVLSHCIEDKSVSVQQDFPFAVNPEEDGDLPMLGSTQSDAYDVAKSLINQNEAKDLIDALLDATEGREKSKFDPAQLNPFAPTKYEGEMLSGGEEIQLTINGNELRGVTFDHLLPISKDMADIYQLIESSKPLERKLKKLIFKGSSRISKKYLTRSGPGLDSGKMVLYQISDYIFQRSKSILYPSTTKPLVTIIVDASGSMRIAIELVKIILVAFLNTLKLLKTDLLVATYGNDGKSRIDYLYNEGVTSKNKDEAISRLVNATTYGGQEDSLALTSILLNARRRYGKSKKNYILFLTDEGFCKSFPQMTGDATIEVIETLKECRKSWFDSCHITLFSFSSPNHSRLEQVVDNQVYLPKDDSDDSILQTADKLGTYVLDLLLNQKTP